MATRLTNISITARRGIRYSIYFFIFLIIARFTINFAATTYRSLNPQGPPPPTIGFGPLPAIKFPKRPGLPEINYTIETPTGTLPQLQTQAKVFFMPKQSATLSSLDNARAKARALGFTNEPIQISQSEYRFNSPSLPSSLEVNIITGVMQGNYNLAFDPSPISFRPPTTEAATGRGRALLRSANSLPAELNEGRVTHDFLRAEGTNLLEAISLSEANLTRVHFFRKDIDNIPSVTPNPLEANVFLALSGSREQTKELIALKYRHFPISADNSHTYPLKTAEEAIGELLGGRAFIANLGLNQDGNVTVRDIYLAYFDPGEQSEFYQPVVVFEGDDQFFAYVPAVSSEYYNLSQE